MTSNQALYDLIEDFYKWKAEKKAREERERLASDRILTEQPVDVQTAVLLGEPVATDSQ